jgi:hypothetical protein
VILVRGFRRCLLSGVANQTTARPSFRDLEQAVSGEWEKARYTCGTLLYLGIMSRHLYDGVPFWTSILFLDDVPAIFWMRSLLTFDAGA